jgi:hypothetical protein
MTIYTGRTSCVTDGDDDPKVITGIIIGVVIGIVLVVMLVTVYLYRNGCCIICLCGPCRRKREKKAPLKLDSIVITGPGPLTGAEAGAHGDNGIAKSPCVVVPVPSVVVPVPSAAVVPATPIAPIVNNEKK